MSNESTVRSQLERIKRLDPALYNALDLAFDDVYKIFNTVFPPASRTNSASGIITLLDAVANFVLEAFPTVIFFNWDRVSDAFSYIIKVGSDWDTAELVIETVSNEASIDPRSFDLIYGDYTFLIKAKTSSGLFGDGPTSVTLNVPQIGAPNLTGTVITNNVLLYWTVPTSLWEIDHYIIFKDSVAVGITKGTFAIVSELTAGTRDYAIEAVDIIGNVGTPSPVATLVTLDPENFLNLAELNAAYTGTYDHCRNINYLGLNGVIGAIYIETWANHFISNGWTTIQNQIDAGYPRYNQPTYTIGFYQEVFDFGSILNNCTVTALWETLQLAGDVTITIAIASSTDNITYSGFTTSPSVFYASIRYAKIKYIFNNLDDTSYAFIYNLRARLDVQLSLDSGNGTAVASDSSGTLVTFNKTFKIVNSFTVAGAFAQPVTALYQSVTTTTARVLLFDSAGIRLSGTFSWKARGVI